MKTVRGYKTELDLTNEQRTACLKHVGAARFAYNWGLSRSKEVYRTTGKRPPAIEKMFFIKARKGQLLQVDGTTSPFVVFAFSWRSQMCQAS